MQPFGSLRRGVRRAFRLGIRRPAAREADIDTEIAAHLDERVEQLMARGRSRAEALAEAHRRFGDLGDARRQLVASARERDRSLAWRERRGALAQDVRLALRRLRRAPGFVLVSVLALALGIGAGTTVFTWMEGLVLNPLPLVADAAHLVALSTGDRAGGTQSVSYPDYLDWAASARSLRDVVVYRQQQLSLRTSPTSDAEQVWGVLASANYFRVLGVRPVLGRTFAPEESAPTAAAGSAPVVVIGHELWQRLYGGRPDVLGRSLWLDGERLTIIGVAPRGFHGTNVGFGFDLWAPVTMQPALLHQPAAKLTWRATRWMRAFARLAPGVTLAQARDELRAIGARIAATHPEDAGLAPAITPLFDAEASGSLRPAFAALLGATGLLFVIVAVNLAGIQLVRATARDQELAVRLALGAARGRIVRQFAIETTLVAAAGTLAALGVAWWARGLLGRFLAHSTFPIADAPAPDARVFAFAAVAGLVIVLVVGVWPAYRAARLAELPLRAAGNRSVTSHGRVRELLVVAQLALSLVGVTSAALLVRSLQRLRATDTGLTDPAHVLLASSDFDLVGGAYAGFSDDPVVRAKRLPEAMEILRRARALPGVRDAALMDATPLGLVSSYDAFDVAVPGHVAREGEGTSVAVGYVTPSYFAVVGPPVVRGRPFGDADRVGTPRVTVVNEAFAHRYWPGPDPDGDAIGRHVHIGSYDLTVVGVARDARFRDLTDPVDPFFYLAYAQWGPSTLTVAVRTAGDPTALAAALRRIFHDVDPALPFLDPHTLADQVAGALTLQRLGAALLSTLAGLALAVAGLGLYGALAQVVQQRRREIGVRMALGAGSGHVLRHFTRRGLALAAAGVALGLPGAWAAGRVLRGQLYGVSLVDPLALGATAALFAVVAVTASVVTARRAARTDPAQSLVVES